MIQRVPETGSTSADLAERLRAGEFVPEGHWLVADRQTAGKGRRGRDWYDGAGNFMGSTLVHLRYGDADPATLALSVGLVVHEVLAPRLPQTNRPLLKWPNDLLVDGAKLAGILLERVGDAVVVGIGVNLASAPQLDDRQTTALSAFGSAPTRDAFAADLMRAFDVEVERWRAFGLAPIIKRWLAAAHPLGTGLRVSEADGTAEGRFAGLTDLGSLQLRLADGTTRVIHGGEVHLASPQE